MKRRLLFLGCALALFTLSCSSSDSGNSETSEGSDKGNEASSDDHKKDNTNDSDKDKTDKKDDSSASSQCDSNEMLCNGICTDVKYSKKNCGKCGNACDKGETCSNGKCTGCDKTTCGSECVDITSDANHCGACNSPCAANMVCNNSQCECAENYTDCDGDPVNGCETMFECECILGQTRSYYDGPDGTENVGECKAGVTTCVQIGDMLIFDVTTPATLPTNTSECTDKDYNCNGLPDGEEDNDHDGFTVCNGDCCDSTETCSALNPELINPGMLEVDGNQTDDNCNGQTDEVEDKDSLSKDLPEINYTHNASDMDTTAKAMARAMGIVWECNENMSCAYGLINARLTRSESTVLPDPNQVNIMSAMRENDNTARILPKEGNSFAVISTGYAIDVKSGLTHGHKWFEEKAKEDETLADGSVQRFPKDSKIPEVYLQNHDNKLGTHAKCPANPNITPAIFDSVQLHLELKVPINAKGIAFDFRFLSQEYPKYLCSAFNDFFLALLTTTHEDLQAYPDHNIAFDKAGNPVSVNNGFFTTCDFLSCEATKCPGFMTCNDNKQCVNEECSGDPALCTPSEITCQDGATAINAYYPLPYSKYSYTSSDEKNEGRGGATAWLSTKAPVVGGETIQLDFYIWDTQDGNYDSTVLLDNFRWLIDETKVNTGFADDPEDVA